MCVCAPCACLVPMEVRKRHWIPWNWSCRWLWGTMWVLGTNLHPLEEQLLPVEHLSSPWKLLLLKEPLSCFPLLGCHFLFCSICILLLKDFKILCFPPLFWDYRKMCLWYDSFSFTVVARSHYLVRKGSFNSESFCCIYFIINSLAIHFLFSYILFSPF